MNKIFRAACALAALALAQSTWAQVATTSGTSATTCTQSGATLVCITATTVALPTGANLSGMAIIGSAPNAPACASLTASPSVIPAGVNTSILLTVNGCPASSTYTYTWASPVQAATTRSTTHALTLSASSGPQLYSVQVCLASAPTSCSTYLAGVSVQSGVQIPSLSGCSVTPATSSIAVGGGATLSATCGAGTAAGSYAVYQWSRNGNAIGGATGASYSLSTSDTAAAGTAIYSVQIINGAAFGNNASASASVTTTAVVVAGPTDYCPSSPVRATIIGSATFQRVWTDDFTRSFPAGSTFVIQVNVDASAATAGGYLATLNFSDAGSERGGRYVTLSKSKCDFTETAQWLSPNFLGRKTAVNAGSASIAIGASDTRAADIRLDSTGIWYLNIQNVIGQCPANSSCHAVIDWAN